jgi:hypothetical protein
MSKTVDTAGATAGAAAAESAGEFIDNMFGEEQPQPQPQPEPQPEPQPGMKAGDPGELSDFVPIDPPKPAEDEPVLPIKTDESVPDHVVRKGDEAIKTWKQLRSELETERQKAIDIERDRQMKEQELEELRKKLETAPSEDKLKEMEDKLKEQEDYIGQMDITRSKVFQETYDKPFRDLFGKVVRQFMRSGKNQEQAVELARTVFRPGMNDPARLEEVLPEETAVTIGAVATLLEDREDLARRRDDAIKNWRETRAAIEVEETRRVSTSMAEQLTRVSEQAFEAVSKDGSWLYQRGQDPKWNEGVEARRNAAIGYIRAGKPEDLARLVFEGIAAPTYRKGYEQLKTKYEDLKSKYDAIANRTRPSLGGSSNQPTTRAPGEAAPPTSVNEFVDQNWEQ